MKGTVLRVGTSQGATVRSPKPPKQHAVPFGTGKSLCGAMVEEGRRMFAFSPFACLRCCKILNAQSPSIKGVP